MGPPDEQAQVAGGEQQKGVSCYCYDDYNPSIQLMVCHWQGHQARKCI